MSKKLIYMMPVFLVLSVISSSYADVVIGDWENGSYDAWIDWGGGQATIESIGAPKYTFSTVGATLGESSLKVSPGSGWQQNLSISLADIGGLEAFMSGTAFAIDVTYNSADWDPATTYAQVYQVSFNNNGFGWSDVGGAAAPTGMAGVVFTDTLNPDSPGAIPLIDPGTEGTTITGTWTWDYSGVIDKFTLPDEDAYIQIVIATNSDAAGAYYFDNARIVGAEPPAPKIVYVDAAGALDPNVPANTFLATGEDFLPVDVGSGGSGVDGLWRIRYNFANGGTIIESRGDWGADNSEDCPRLMTSVDVPEGNYEVYAYMWTAGTAQWRLGASLTDDANELPVYLCTDPNGAAVLADANDFEEPVPLVTEADRTMWQIPLGTTGVTTAITVYIDDDILAPSDVSAGGNARTWYDGIGYKVAPAPEGPSLEGLVAYYAMEGDATDSSGNGLDGIEEIIGDGNAAIYVAGPVGMAIDLLPGSNGTIDGSIGPYVNCGNSPLFDFTDAMTVGAWVNIRSLPEVWRAVVAKGDSAWRLATNNTSSGFQFAFGGAGRGWPGANSATEVAFDEWHYVCGTYDKSVGGCIYIDGQLDGTNTDTGGIDVDTYNVWIGGNEEDQGWRPYRLFDGMIDEVMIFDRALSADEVMALASM